MSTVRAAPDLTFDRDSDFDASRTKMTGALSSMGEHITVHLDLEERTALFRLASPFRILNLLNRGRYRRLDGALLPALDDDRSASGHVW